MKYLKPHPINESNDIDIKHDIEDILLELNDKGIWTEVKIKSDNDQRNSTLAASYVMHVFNTKPKAYEITMQRDILDTDEPNYYENFYERVKWIEVEEVVDRLIEFFKLKGYNKLSIMVDGSVDREDINWINFIKVNGDYEFDSLTFWFSN